MRHTVGEECRRACPSPLPGAGGSGAKAQVQFKGMVEVRNRLVSAYQDIMNMPV